MVDINLGLKNPLYEKILLDIEDAHQNKLNPSNK